MVLMVMVARVVSLLRKHCSSKVRFAMLLIAFAVPPTIYNNKAVVLICHV